MILRVGVIACEQRQLIRLIEDAGQVGAAQVVLARTRLGCNLYQYAGVDVALVVAANACTLRADGECMLALRDRAATAELGIHRGNGGVVGVSVDRTRVERNP